MSSGVGAVCSDSVIGVSPLPLSGANGLCSSDAE